MENITVRLASEADLTAINDIYNYYVVHTTCTYQEEPETVTGREQWFRKHGPEYPVTVAASEGAVVGWASLSPYHVRSAYRYTVENSVYVHPEFHRRGIGSKLLEDIVERARVLRYQAIIAAIDSSQLASVALHTRQGFQTVGQFKQVGLKFGKWLDVTYLELLLGHSASLDHRLRSRARHSAIADQGQKACARSQSSD